MTTTRTDIVTVTVDCHAYPWHVREDWMGDDYAEVGPDNLVRMAETFAVMVEHLPDDHPDNPVPGWAYWYRITGPRDNVVRLLADEYLGDGIAAAEDYVDGNVGAYKPIGFTFHGIMYGSDDG